MTNRETLRSLAERVEALGEGDPVIGLVGEPKPHERHPNQRKGLDLYVRVVNFDTGETCFKKLYEGKRGLHFKHTGYSPMYLADFTARGTVIPFQVRLATPLNDGEGLS